MRLDDICFLSDLPFIRLYLPMKSISNSDHIYFGIACQKSIPRFLLISVKYLCLSTFPKVADLIGGPISYRFSFPLAGLSNWEMHLRDTQKYQETHPLHPFPLQQKVGRSERPQPESHSGCMNRNRTTFVAGWEREPSLCFPRGQELLGTSLC